MAVNLSPVAGAAAQFFDNSGNVLTGGKLYTYDAGTTTPAPTYTNSSGATAQPNPIILNAAGRVPDSGEIWLADSVSYKFVLKDQNDVLIGTYDNLIGINSNFVNFTGEEETQVATQGQTVFTLTTLTYQPATNNLLVFVNGSKQVSGVNYAETSSTVVTFVDGLNVGDVVDFCTATPINTSVVTAAQVLYNEGAAAAVNRTVESKLQETVSVKDFGATGDGVTDDTAAIQAAINGINNGDYTGALFFPAGSYNITSKLTIGTVSTTVVRPMELYGEGMATQIINNAPTSNPCFDFSGTTGVYLHDMCLTGNTAHPNDGVWIDGTTYAVVQWTIERVHAFMAGHGFKIKNTNTGVINNCSAWSNQLDSAIPIPQTVTTGILNGIDLSGSNANAITIQDCVCLSTTSYYGIHGVMTGPTTGLKIIGGTVETRNGSTPALGCHLDNFYASTVTGLYYEDANFDLVGGGGNTITNLGTGFVGGFINLSANAVNNTFINCYSSTFTIDDSSFNNTIVGCYGTISDATGAITTSGLTPCNTYINSFGQPPIRGLFKNYVVGVSGSYTPDCSKADTHILVVNTSAPFTINAPIKYVDGTRLVFIIRNQSGTFMGTVTWNSIYKMSTWTNPDDNKNNSLTFEYSAYSNTWTQITPTITNILNF